MDQQPSLDLVYLAVHTLYHDPSSAEKEKASAWLGDLQKSVYSWSVSDQILQEKKNVEACYFAAQTMRSKIQLSFHELPVNVHGSLRDSLMQHISQITQNSQNIITMQLCLAVADFALQMTEWKKPIIDLMNRFGQTNIWPLLEIMIVFPEELESRTVRLGANRRLEILEELKSCAPTVLEFLRMCVASGDTNEQLLLKIIRCFTSWVNVQAITLADVSNNVVVAKSFQILSDRCASSKLHDTATDCLCTLLQSLEDNNNQQELEMQLYQGVLGLETCYHYSVANEDLEKSINYCRIFTELAESFLDKILVNSTVESQHYAIKILDLVLMCVGHHDYEVAEITFNLWYRLSEEVYQRNNKQLTEMFKPHIERLITALYRHAQMEPDQEGLLDDGDDFKDFRLKVCDLIKDTVFIVGSSNCFKQMFLNLQAENVSWDTSEAALFIMNAVAKNILPEENEVVPKVVEAILNLPENTHLAVRYTSVLLLGELCEWIEKHPESLEPILNFLLFSLQQRGVATAAATSLQSICVTCNVHLAKHIPVLLHLLQQIDTIQLPPNSVLGILKGAAAIVGAIPDANMIPVLREICLLQINPLCEIIKRENEMAAAAAQGSGTVLRGSKNDPVVWLDRLAAVFRYVDINVSEGQIHPCRDLITEVWPVLTSTFTTYQYDLRIMERTCRCVRFMLRCLSKHGRHLFEPLVEQIVVLYRTYPHSCFLYLASILVDEYATDENCIHCLIEMLQALIEPTFNLLKEENGLRNHPDTVDDFFRLCTRFLQRSSLTFLQCTALPLIIQCGLMSCSLDHKEANLSVMRFFFDLIHGGRTSDNATNNDIKRQVVLQIVADYGQQLVNNLMHACVFCLHTYMLSDVADVIVALMETDRQALDTWLQNAMQSIQNTGTVRATPQQLIDFHIAVARSDTSKSVTHALKDLIRLYR